eukprot:69370-Amphidinium_carterae.1
MGVPHSALQVCMDATHASSAYARLSVRRSFKPLRDPTSPSTCPRLSHESTLEDKLAGCLINRVSNGGNIVQDTGQICTKNLQVKSMAQSGN